MRREICGECGSPINDDGSCICTELPKRGWRLCAKGQKATQWCAIAESVRGELREQKQCDEALLRQALEALIWTTGSEDFGEGGLAREGALKLLFPTIAALRERLGDEK
jgi:hypothetical protein